MTLETLEARQLLTAIGLNIEGRNLANSGNIPPDTMGAVGRDHIVEMINGAYAVYDKLDGGLLGQSSLDQFWTNGGVTWGSRTYDPRVLYDPGVNRFYAMALDNPGGDNNFLFAISRTDNPLNGWTGFSVDADTHTGQRWADFPQMNFDSEGVYISVNMLDMAGAPAYDSTRTTLVLPKTDLLQQTPSIANRTLIEDHEATTGFFAQGAIYADDPSAGLSVMFVATDGTAGDKLRISRLTGTINSPSFQFVREIAVTACASPPLGRQPNDAGLSQLETGGLRIRTETVYHNGSVWGVAPVDDPSSPDGAIRFFEVDEATGILRQEVFVRATNLDLFYPSVAVSGGTDSETVVIGMTASGPNQFAGSYAVIGQTTSGATTFGALLELRAGTATYENLDGTRNRWGDYSATLVDPFDSRVFWTIQERAAGVNPIPFAPSLNWSTQITQLLIDGVPPIDGYVELNPFGAAVVEDTLSAGVDPDLRDVLIFATDTNGQASITASSAAFDPAARLWDFGANRLLDVDRDSFDDAANVQANVVWGHPYAVEVFPESGLGNYLVDFMAPAPAINTLALDADGEVLRADAMNGVYDTDYFKIIAPVTAAGRLDLQLGCASPLDAVLTVYDASGVQLARANLGVAGQSEVLSLSGVSPGAVYYVRVGSARYQTQGDYVLLCDFAVSLPTALSAAEGFAYFHQDGSSYDTQTFSGSTGHAYIDYDGEWDSFYFAGEWSGSYRVTVNALTGTVDPVVAIYDAVTGQRLAFDDDSGGGTSARCVLDLDGFHRYVVAVADDDRSGYGDVEIVIQAPGSTLPDVIAIGGNGDGVGGGDIRVATDADYFSFTSPAWADGDLTVAVTPAAGLDVAAMLFSAAGQSLGGEHLLRAGVPETLLLSGLAPSTTYYLTVLAVDYATSGSYSVDVQFGVAVPSGSIYGTKYEDLNGNGARDAGEPGLPGWRIYVDANHNEVFDLRDDPSALTDLSGNYLIANLPLNVTHSVYEQPQSGWILSQPSAGHYEIPLNAFDPYAVCQFGNFRPARVEGQKWNDLNGDGAWNVSEPHLAGWVIYADLDDSGARDPGEPFDTTDSTGSYELLDVLPGTWRIREEPQAGWMQRFPAAGYRELSLESGASVVAIDFGNQALTADIGDIFATAATTGLGGGVFQIDTLIGDGLYGNEDVDMFRLSAVAGTVLTVETSLPPGGAAMDTILRLFDTTRQLAVNDNVAHGSVYSRIEYTFAVSGTYYIGVSGAPNDRYDPTETRHGQPGSTGDYRLWMQTAAPQDFGDAPDPSYPTLIAHQGASHALTMNGPWLGDVNDAPDGEPNGQPHGGAMGDDNDIDPLNTGLNRDDENGILSTTLYIGMPGSVSVQVSDNAGAGGVLDLWIDYDRDGTWNQPNERLYSGLLYSGYYGIPVLVPEGTPVGPAMLRARISTRGTPLPWGPAPDGEVEDHVVMIEEAVPVLLDFGDAPSLYPTLLADNGARHIIGGPWLGGPNDAPDPEPDGQPGSQAAGDDGDLGVGNPGPNYDDENGISVYVMHPGLSAEILIEVSDPQSLGGLLDLWVDWNANGSWSDPGEKVFAGFADVGQNLIAITVPSSAAIGPTYVRARISTLGGLDPWGPAPDGEVEDRLVYITTLPPPTDFGDAPGSTYHTLSSDMGAFHVVGGPWLGGEDDVPDGEPDGQPEANANGDDQDIDPNNPLPDYDDENGVVVPALLIGRPALIEVQVSDPSGIGGYLDLWIDFNRDGAWHAVDEKVFAGLLLPGSHTLLVSVPTTAVAGPSFLRARIGSTGTRNPYGSAADGEVEDHRVWIETPPPLWDFGDAPDPTYPTLLANDGARHLIGGPWLGGDDDSPDDESDGKPDAAARGDDKVFGGNSPHLPGDDEDGVTAPLLRQGQAAAISVQVSDPGGLGGFVNLWIDFDGDGSWNQANEAVFAGLLSVGVHAIPIVVPATAHVGQSFLRARINSQGSLLPTGSANDGEVEDYIVSIDVPPGPTVRVWDGEGADNKWTTDANWSDDVRPLGGDYLVFPSGAMQMESVNDYPAGTKFGEIRFTGGSATVTTLINATTVDVQAGQLTAASIVADTLVIGAGSSVVIAPYVPPGSTASVTTTTSTQGSVESPPVRTRVTPVAVVAVPVPVTTVPTTITFVGPLSAITPQPATTDAALTLASPALPVATPVPLIASLSQKTAPKAAALKPVVARVLETPTLDSLTLLLAMERSATELSAQRHLRAIDAVLAEGVSGIADVPDAFAPAKPMRRKMADRSAAQA